jgi:acyl-coenzyme A thioesterase PaaI-like protein
MTPADIKDLVATRIPMATTLHLEMDEVARAGARLLLRHQPALLNHNGTLHVGAQTTAAETAAIAVSLAALDHIEVTSHSKSVELRFRKPARADVWASAQLPPDSVEGLETRLTAEGKVDLAVLVELSDPTGERIAEGTITITLRRM